MTQTKLCQVCGAPYGRKWGLPQFLASKVCSRGCAVRLGHPNRKWPTQEERFWAKVDKTPGHGPNGECWVWTAYRDGFGYGIFRPQRGLQNTAAHRASYEMNIGPIDGHDVLHHCDNPSCIRPDHLFLGNDALNTADKVSKGRQRGAPGETNANAVLTEGKVRAIRRDTRSSRRVAEDYGVHASAIKSIRSGRTWRHVV